MLFMAALRFFSIFGIVTAILFYIVIFMCVCIVFFFHITLIVANGRILSPIVTRKGQVYVLSLTHHRMAG